MSLIQKYKYQPFKSAIINTHFEVDVLQMDSYCMTTKDEIADYFKIYWIEDGSGTYQIDFKKVRINGAGIFCLSPGQVLCVDSEQMRSGYRISFDKEFYCVEAHGKEIACNGLLFNNVHRASVINVSPNEVPVFRQLIDNLVAELKQPGAAHRAMLEAYLRMFLIQALRKLEEQQPKLSVNGTAKNQLAQDFIALVNKNFRQIHAVKDYAARLFISPKSLAKQLNIHGYPKPTEIIQERILLQAKRELRFSNKAVKEIAYDLGYEDPAYFSRLFAKKEGISPLIYRNGEGKNLV